MAVKSKELLSCGVYDISWSINISFLLYVKRCTENNAVKSLLSSI